MEIIKQALAKGQSSLSEHDAKKLCSDFGIPVCREVIAADVDSAVTEAVKIGFPVVLKASGENLFHKTEVGGIALNLTSEEEVKRESRRLLQIPDSEALLVQEMVRGERELVCGLIRDAQFGPCVMFGLGGILVEIFKDVSFRIVPLTRRDAGEMIREIKGYPLLEGYRGQEPVDVANLEELILKVSSFVEQNPEVNELDLNPIFAYSDGAVAVDARIVLEAMA